MKRNKTLKILATCIGAWLLSGTLHAEKLDLAGMWRFQLDPMGFGKTPGSELYLSRLTETITLPGSTDEGGKGIRNIAAHVDRLSRKFEYCGQAWYQREVVIPDGWKGKEITLFLERCHWETSVYVDGQPAGTDERLSTPNRFVLTQQLTPGIHTLTLCIDNRLKYPMDQWTHGTSEYTQTNWNGVVGRIELQARPSAYIHKMNLYPDIDKADVRIFLDLHSKGKADKGTLTLRLREKDGREISTTTLPVSFPADTFRVEHTLSIHPKEMKLWNEFMPSLYTLEAVLESEAGRDTCRTDFGMRYVEQGKHHIRLNGRDIHLRGVLDCCVFPLTGYPATDVPTWERIFRTVKNYGMNHVRFHSWCPPQAAFEAADQVGIYLQVELPMWIKDVGQYPSRRDFFEKEMYAILDEYGNHPSFLLYCNGNENEGDFAVLEDLIKKGRSYDSRHLYSASTARTHVPSDQFYTSHVTGKGWITVYEGQPSTDWDRSEASDIDVPVIAHETGQRCMYPDFKEMSKYTGVLEPRNFMTFQERLARNGMLNQAEDFFRATGAHTVLQYKEVNEALLRTPTSGGFQLLGLADFPGQGSAFVGILDAFWESKGLVTPEKFRESCAPTVLLARLPKRTFTNRETLNAKLGIYHFGPKAIGRGSLNWKLTDERGKTIRQGTWRHPKIAISTVDSLGTVEIPLSSILQAGKFTLQACLDNGIRNEWDIWVYPSPEQEPTPEFAFVRQWTEAKARLENGEAVWLIPDSCAGRKAKFTGHFWNPIMFNWDPMIVGTLIQDRHPAFHLFPTSYYADWQWWDILNNATAMDLTDLYTLTPIIQSIDTYEVNRKLGIAFEAKVGKGKLFVLCVNLDKGPYKTPAMQQLLLSVQSYVQSDHFQPEASLSLHELDKLFDKDKLHKTVAPTNNEAVRQLLNQ